MSFDLFGKLRCDNCSAPLSRVPGETHVTCGYCQTRYAIEWSEDGGENGMTPLPAETGLRGSAWSPRQLPLHLKDGRSVLWVALILYLSVLCVGYGLSLLTGGGVLLLCAMLAWLVLSLIGRFVGSAPEIVRRLGEASLGNVFPMGLLWALLVCSGVVAVLMPTPAQRAASAQAERERELLEAKVAAEEAHREQVAREEAARIAQATADMNAALPKAPAMMRVLKKAHASLRDYRVPLARTQLAEVDLFLSPLRGRDVPVPPPLAELMARHAQLVADATAMEREIFNAYFLLVRKQKSMPKSSAALDKPVARRFGVPPSEARDAYLAHASEPSAPVVLKKTPPIPAFAGKPPFTQTCGAAPEITRELLSAALSRSIAHLDGCTPAIPHKKKCWQSTCHFRVTEGNTPEIARATLIMANGRVVSAK